MFVAIDTETHGGFPFSIQVSIEAGTGVFVKLSDTTAVKELAACVNELLCCGWVLAFHHAGADLGIAQSIGINCATWHDTMQEAYHQGNLPQGLKALTYRLFRTTMVSWEDTVRPASINALLSWLAEAMVVARLDLFSTKVKVYKTCLCGHSEKAHLSFSHAAKCSCSDYTPREEREEVRGPAEALFARLGNHTDVNEEYDPWLRLREWRDENDHDYAHVLARCGPWPILGIGNCSEAQAIRYAVGDADATLQVAMELARRRRESRFDIAPGDEDK